MREISGRTETNAEDEVDIGLRDYGKKNVPQRNNSVHTLRVEQRHI